MSRLQPFLGPRSVAILGAGERATSSGGAVLRNLQRAGFTGRITPVNPKGGTILGLAAARSLKEIAEPAELAVIAVRPDLIPALVEEAAASGHKNLLILPGGFREAGAEGRRREAEVKRIADKAGITIAGPNSAGVIHLDPSAPFAATFLRDLPPGGGIAFLTQSGAMAEEVIAAANERNLPVRTIVSVGNGLHLGVDDFLEHLGGDPACKSVLLYIESVEDEARFRKIARRVAANKPVVALIGGRTAAGAEAVQNHTGARAFPEAAAERFCRECGMIRVKSFRRLLLAAKGFGFHPQGMGRRVFLLSNSGGPGVVTSDRVIKEGLTLPPLPQAMVDHLAGVLPAEAAIANPIDLLADAREERFGVSMEAAREHGAFDALLMIHVVPFMVDADPVIERIARLAPGMGVPVMHSMMGTLPKKREWFARLEAAGVALFNDAEEMAEAAGIVARYPKIQTELVEH
jgi:acetyltransferase